MRLGLCKRAPALCADCRDTTCAHAGDKGADCPKYTCDNKVLLDCEHCQYINQYLRIMRNELRKEA